MSSDWIIMTALPDGVWRIDETYINPAARGLIWFVKGQKKNLLIDSGYGFFSLRQVIPWLRTGRIMAVATHTHCDHIGGLWEFEQRAVHCLEAPVLVRPTAVATQSLPFLADPTVFKQYPPQWQSAEAFRIRPAPATRLLRDHDLFDLGDRQFKVLHTPGHSPGSICLWEAETGLLFSGDTIFDGPLFDSIPGANKADLLASHRRLCELPVRQVHPGHFVSFSGSRLQELAAGYARNQEMG
jgi:glyoxylase-like metal-dependent hydrolase (beta-lactamase superfamily II)